MHTPHCQLEEQDAEVGLASEAGKGEDNPPKKERPRESHVLQIHFIQTFPWVPNHGSMWQISSSSAKAKRTELEFQLPPTASSVSSIKLSVQQ